MTKLVEITSSIQTEIASGIYVALKDYYNPRLVPTVRYEVYIGYGVVAIAWRRGNLFLEHLWYRYVNQGHTG